VSHRWPARVFFFFKTNFLFSFFLLGQGPIISLYCPNWPQTAGLKQSSCLTLQVAPSCSAPTEIWKSLETHQSMQCFNLGFGFSLKKEIAMNDIFGNYLSINLSIIAI
jgi:hypothetical protein